MLKLNQEINDRTPISLNSKIYPHLRKFSSYSKDNNSNINPKKKTKYLKIKSFHNQEGTTTHEDSTSKLSNSQNTKKRRKSFVKSASLKTKKREREKLVRFLNNNEKVKIPNCKIKSNVGADLKLDIDNIDKILQKHTKERNDSFGNKITKSNKKNVHISFQKNNKQKKFIELIPIESFKSFNMIEQNQNKIAKPYISRCCAIF